MYLHIYETPIFNDKTIFADIINQFSPLLVGASERVAPAWFQRFAQFNVAVSGSTAENLTVRAYY
jgi:hypothetical protein